MSGGLTAAPLKLVSTVTVVSDKLTIFSIACQLFFQSLACRMSRMCVGCLATINLDNDC